MPELAEFQRRFAAAATAATRVADFPAPAFAVYRNSWRKAAGDALGATYPVVAALIGERAFGSLVAHHLERHPPRSPVMTHFGAGFSDSILQTPLAGSLPYLADVARLEWLVSRVLHAAPGNPIPPQLFARGDELSAENLCFALLPAARIAEFATPAVTIWAAHDRPEGPGRLAPDWRAERALIVRRGSGVAVEPTDAATFAFFTMIDEGRSLGSAAVALSERFPEADLASILASLARSGAFAAHIEGDRHAD